MIAQPLLVYSTPIWRLSAPDRLMKALPRIADKIKGDVEAGVFDQFVNRSNFNGFQSPQRPLKANPYFLDEERATLVHMIDEAVGLSEKFRITSAINCSPPGSYNSAHVHPGVQIAGAFYISVPQSSGSIVFRDPRPQCEMSGLNHTLLGKEMSLFNPRYPVRPRAGDLLLFPAWLMHQVEPGQSQEGMRISMAINIIGLASD